MTVALVVFAIGDEYLKHYNNLFRTSHEVYAKKHMYDFKVITDFLDPEIQDKNTISLNKLLLCSQPWSNAYDFIIYLDADILINPQSPPLHTFCQTTDGIGMVDEYTQPTCEKRLQVQEKMGWEKCATDYFKLGDIDFETVSVYNGGLMVFQPKKHREFLETVYKKYILNCIGHPRGLHYEQTVVNYEIQKNKMCAVLPNQFDAIWPIYKEAGETNLVEFFFRNCFVHFAGGCDHWLIPQLNEIIKSVS